MLTIDAKDIRNAAVHGTNFFPYYKSHIKRDLATGFGIQFDTFGELGNFLVTLGSNAMYNEADWNSTRIGHVTPDDARMLANSLQIDPLSDGLVAYFPGWELSES
jgi:hypothetical protein